MKDKHRRWLLTCMTLVAGLHLEGCSPRPSDSQTALPAPTAGSVAAPVDAASGTSIAPAQADSGATAKGHGHDIGRVERPVSPNTPIAAAPAPAPAPVPTPVLSTPGPHGSSPSGYPHVDAIFYAETPEKIGEEAKACLEVLPPGVSASSVNQAAYQCKPESTETKMTQGSPVARDDGAPGVDTSEYMKAALDYDSEDFEVPTRELLMHFASPGQHKSFEFKVIPKRIGDRKLAVRLFTTDKDGNAIDDIFDGSSTVHVNVGHDPITIFDWLLDHWEGLAGIGAALLALWALLTRKPLEWFRQRKAGPVTSTQAPAPAITRTTRGDTGSVGDDNTG